MFFGCFYDVPAFNRHCEERSDEAIHAFFVVRWIASRSLSSGAHSRDPLARNDEKTLNPLFLRRHFRRFCFTMRRIEVAV